MRYILSIGILYFVLCSCDHVENPYPPTVSIDLDTTLYPGLWSDYQNNEWPIFDENSNTERNVIIEDFTGHKCVFCPAAADLAHQLHIGKSNQSIYCRNSCWTRWNWRFQSVSPPDYPTDFTNPQGVEIGQYFGENDGGFRETREAL